MGKGADTPTATASPRASSELEKVEEASDASSQTVTTLDERVLADGAKVVGTGETNGDAPPTTTITEEKAHDEELPSLTKRNKVIIVCALCVYFFPPLLRIFLLTENTALRLPRCPRCRKICPRMEGEQRSRACS